jgi:hypothetical protein
MKSYIGLAVPGPFESEDDSDDGGRGDGTNLGVEGVGELR